MLAANAACTIRMPGARDSSTYRCCVLAVLVSNLLHSGVTHEVGGLVPSVLHGCAIWGSQGRVCSQVDVLQLHSYSQRVVGVCRELPLNCKYTVCRPRPASNLDRVQQLA